MSAGCGRVVRRVAVVLLALGIAARLSNGWTFPVLGGYDAFSHFTYVWSMAQTGRVPVAANGWSYFHPPLYYAFMATVWNLLDGIDPVSRLRVGKEAVAAFGCLHALAAWWMVRRRFPDDATAALGAAALVLLTPVMLYTAGFVGNEGLNAVLGGLGFVALLRALERPSAGRAVLLGLLLGLGLLTKFSASAVAGTALAALALRSLRGERRAAMRRALAVATVTMFAVCGPYYARNVWLYGRPFQLSRDLTFLTAYVEENQPQALRGPAAYLTFDPMIFRRPVWPRAADSAQADDALRRSVRESVWTGIYANTWFDGYGGWVVPPVTESEVARRTGQASMLLGLAPTALVLLGLATALRRRPRDWDDFTLVAALATAAMVAQVVFHTHQAPIAAAVKASYCSHVAVPFAYWFALGVRRSRQWPRLAASAAAACLLLGGLSLAVGWHGVLFTPGAWPSAIPGYDAALENQLGVVRYAGGERDGARRAFERAARAGEHLAVENLGLMAVDEGRLRDGLRLLRRAASLQREAGTDRPLHRDEYLRLSAAEYDHSIAVVLHALGHARRAEARWAAAIRSSPDHAEARYCLALSILQRTAGRDGAEQGLRRAARELEAARQADPGFGPAWKSGAAVQAMLGDCEAARGLLAVGERPSFWVPRRFPAEAGNGAGLAASIGRRRLIAPDRALWDDDAAIARCAAAPDRR